MEFSNHLPTFIIQMLGPPKQKPPEKKPPEKNHEPRTADHVAWRPAYEGEEPPF